MTDRQRPDPTPADDQLPDLRPNGDPTAFREALLWRLRDPEHADLLRSLGSVLFDLMNEGGQWGTEPEASIVEGAVRAAAFDFLHAAADLHTAAQDRFMSELTDDEVRLAERAERWSAQVTMLAAAILEELGEELPTGRGPTESGSDAAEPGSGALDAGPADFGPARDGERGDEPTEPTSGDQSR